MCRISRCRFDNTFFYACYAVWRSRITSTHLLGRNAQSIEAHRRRSLAKARLLTPRTLEVYELAWFGQPVWFVDVCIDLRAGLGGVKSSNSQSAYRS